MINDKDYSIKGAPGDGGRGMGGWEMGVGRSFIFARYLIRVANQLLLPGRYVSVTRLALHALALRYPSNIVKPNSF